MLVCCACTLTVLSARCTRRHPAVRAVSVLMMVKALVTIEFMGQMLCVGKFRRLRGQRRCSTRIENTEGARVFERMMLR